MLRKVCISLVLCSPLWAADHYIVPGLATGTHTGANCTNAYSGFGGGAGQVNPASLTRGDTYWLLAGTLSTGINFSTATSGTTVITIEAATSAVHGGASDCTGLYGQTVFGADAAITTSYWTINGQNWPCSVTVSACGTTGYNIFFDNSTDTNGEAISVGPGTNFTIQYVEMQGPHNIGQWSSNTGTSPPAINYGDDALVTPGGSATTNNLYVGYSYLHDVGVDLVGSNNQITGTNQNGSGHTYEHDFFARNWYTCTDSATCNHTQAMSMCVGTFVFRYNTLLDIVQDGAIDINVSGTCPIGSWDIYGNTDEWDNNIPSSRQARVGGFIGGFGQTIAGGLHVNLYNNTFAGIGGLQSGANVIGATFCWSNGVGSTNSGSVNIENNLYWQSGSTGGSSWSDVGCGTMPGTQTVDYNQGFCPTGGCTNGAGYSPTGAHSLNSNTGNPFISWNGTTNFNVSLAADTSAGFSISGWTTNPAGCTSGTNCLNIDPKGITRGSNGTIDRGAFQIPASVGFTTYGTGFGPGSTTIGTPAVTTTPTLPQQGANKIIHPNFTTTRTLGAGKFYACTTGDGCFGQAQQAICDWANDGVDDSWLISVHATTFIQTGLSHTCTQTGATVYKSLTMLPKIISGHLPTGFLVFDSDTPLPEGRTVCSHGTDDTATRQPPSGDISTWWTGTNWGCATDIGSMWTLEGDWVLAGNAGSLITPGPWDPTTNLGASNYVFKDAEFRMTPGVAIPSDMVKTSYGAQATMTNPVQGGHGIHFENLYIHGDATDWCNQVGGITQYGPNATGTGFAVNDTFSIPGGTSTATAKVAAIGPGTAVKRFTITFGGGGYSPATGITPTITSGSGSGLTINIYAVAGSSPACVTSFNTGGPGTNVATDAINFGDCMDCSLKYSYTDYLTRAGSEGHIIGIPRGYGPIAIVHNWLSGQSINIITGGEAFNDPLYYFQNFEYRGNRNTEPPSWIGTGYQGPTGGSGITFKNRQEFKVGQNVLIDGNIWEYSDTSGAQSGQCLQLNPRTCSNAQQCDNPQLVLSDFTITNNICRHAIGGIANVGRSAYPADGGGVAPGFKRVLESNNLMYDMGNSNNLDHNNVVASPYSIRFESSGQAFICNGTNVSGTITLTCAGGITGLSQTQIQVGDYVIVQGCSDSTWNYPAPNTFQYVHGAVALAGTTPAGFTVVYQNNSAVAATATGCVVQNYEGYPNGVTVTHNTFIMDSTQANANSAAIYAGTVPPAFSDTGCAAAGPTNSTATTAISRAGNIVTASVASLTGWGVTLGAGLQTIVEVTGVTPSDFNGNFYYLGQSGGNLTWYQAGANETGTVQGNVAQMGTQCPYNLFSRNITVKNNLLAINATTGPSCPTASVGWNGWFESGGSNQEGCPGGFNAAHCSENILDATTSTAIYTEFPGRCSTAYTEMGGTHAGANPPVTLTFPANNVCSGATADATCVGLKTMMSGAAFDGNDAVFQNYVLVPSSVYHNAADDGTDFGANPSAIQAAINSKLYPCATPCGLLPDSP